MHDKKLVDEALIAELIKRYEPSKIPACHVCGAELSIVRCGGGKPTQYACSKMQLCGTEKMDWNHYEKSSWADYRQGGDGDVIELVNRYRALHAFVQDIAQHASGKIVNGDCLAICAQRAATLLQPLQTQPSMKSA